MPRPWAALFVLLLGCSPKPVDIFHEPHHHFVYKSDKITAWNVMVPPRTATLMHEHDMDYLFVTLGPAVVTSLPLKGAPTQLVLRDGEVRFAKAPLIHVADNYSNEPFHNVTIELAHPATNVTPCDSPCVLTSDQWTVTRMTLAPGERYDTKFAIIVPLVAVELGRRPNQPLHLVPGQVNDTSVPVTNSGPADARFITVEFK